jgi:asparagine synthase (glutamine-hydrolysing)
LGLAALQAWRKDGTQPYDWLDRAARGLPIFWGGAEGFSNAGKQQLLAPALRRRFDGRSSWEAIEPIHQRFLSASETPSPLKWMSYLDLNLRLPELLLMRVDKMSMGTSLEARVPFLDHELVAFALGIPEQVKTRNGVLKATLKRAVRGLIPDAIIDRPKQGFGVPVHEWLQAGLPADLTHLMGEFLRETELFEPQAVKNLFSDPRRSALRWPVLNLALWWDRFIKRGATPMSVPAPGYAAPRRATASAIR